MRASHDGATALQVEKGREARLNFLVSQRAVITPFAAAEFGKLDEEECGSIAHTACIWGRIEVLRHRSRHEIAQRPAGNGRRRAPMILGQRRAELERNCGRIVELPRGVSHVS